MGVPTAQGNMPPPLHGCATPISQPNACRAYESMLRVVPISDMMPLGQKSLISRLPRRG